MTFLVYTSADSPGFERLYALYRSVFPDPDEAEDLPGIKASLELVGDAALTERYGKFEEFWIAALDKGEVAGGVNFTAFKGSRSAHINYLFTSTESRGRGIGSALLEKVREISQADWIFCEQNDPSLMTPEQLEADIAAAGISPEQRSAWWRRRGFGKLDFRYVQPPLSPEKEPAEGMSLNVCPSEGPVPGAIVAEHLRRFFYISVLKKRSGTDARTEALIEDVATRDSIPVIRS